MSKIKWRNNQLCHKMSKSHTARLWKEVYKKNLTRRGSVIMRSILRLHMIVTKIPKMLINYVLNNLCYLHNWPLYVWTSLYQVHFLINLIHSRYVWNLRNRVNSPLHCTVIHRSGRATCPHKIWDFFDEPLDLPETAVTEGTPARLTDPDWYVNWPHIAWSKS